MGNWGNCKGKILSLDSEQDGVVYAVKSTSLEFRLLPEPRKWPTSEQHGLSEWKSPGPCRLESCVWGPPFFCDPTDVGNLISGSFAFLKTA